MKIRNWLLLTLVLLLTFAIPIAKQSAKADSFTYTIRIFAGVQGKFTDGSDVIVLERAYGEHFSFANNSVVLPADSKYYVKGIREAGKDNSTVTLSAPLVTRDQDYVVAYGVLGDPVAYTVRYVDRNGNELAPSDTYYGNIGDRPVIAFRYIENYQPQAYNLTKILTANEADNVFEFVYTRRYVPAAPTAAPTEEPSSEATPASDETPSPTPTLAPGETPSPTPEVTETPTPEPTEEPGEGPVEIIDLDNPDVPLVPGNGNENGGENNGASCGNCNTPLLIGGGAGGAVLLGGIIWILTAVAKKKKNL